MKFLLINQTFYPDPVATAQHLTDLAVELARAGHAVTVVTGRRGYAEPHPLYESSGNYQGVSIRRVWPFSFGRRSRLMRILEALLINLAFAWQVFWLPRFDKVICLTSPPLVGWLAVLITKSRRGEFIYWMMDINPDEAIEAGWLRRESLQAKLIESALRQTLEMSDQIIVLDRFMKDRITAKGADPDKILIVPPWAHTDDVEPVEHEKNPFRKEHGLEHKFVVMYSGNLSVCHPVETLLEAARMLKDVPALVFMFVGGGARRDEVLEFRERHGLENIRFLDYVAREELRHSLSAADLHVVIMGDPFIGIVHPSKLYGIMAVGRPVLLVGRRESAMGEVIVGERIGFQIEHGDAGGAAEAIRRAMRLDVKEKATIFEKETALVSRKYSSNVLIRILIDHILKSETMKVSGHA